jgi:integrase
MGRSKTRRNEWGSVFPKKVKGEQTGWIAQYHSPIDRKLVKRTFKTDQQQIARSWLAEEEKLVRLHERGQETWTHPTLRKRKDATSKISFKEYATKYLDEYRKEDGTKLAAATMRKKRTSVNHLIAHFGNAELSSITTHDIDEWISSTSLGNGAGHALRRAYQELKAIMEKAATATDETPALIPRNPCIRSAPKTKKSEQAQIPEATSEELRILYTSMPDYSRISIYFAAIFGLRISEVCSLQRRDIDLKHKVLHVRHAIQRGDDDTDTGELKLRETKTEDSTDDLPIPESLIPMIKTHLAQFTDGDAQAMLLKPKNTKILNPNTLRGQFEKARETAGRPDLHFHTLRATAITTAVQEGGSPKDVQEYGRHADAEVSLERYQRSSKDKRKNLANKVADALLPLNDRASLLNRKAQIENEIAKLQEELALLNSRLTEAED